MGNESEPTVVRFSDATPKPTVVFGALVFLVFLPLIVSTPLATEILIWTIFGLRFQPSAWAIRGSSHLDMPLISGLEPTVRVWPSDTGMPACGRVLAWEFWPPCFSPASLAYSPSVGAESTSL